MLASLEHVVARGVHVGHGGFLVGCSSHSYHYGWSGHRGATTEGTDTAFVVY